MRSSLLTNIRVYKIVLSTLGTMLNSSSLELTHLEKLNTPAAEHCL